jgi:hypothetical protein
VDQRREAEFTELLSQLLGVVTTSALSWLTVYVRALTALRRTIRIARIDSTPPMRALGVAVARPERTAGVAA